MVLRWFTILSIVSSLSLSAFADPPKRMLMKAGVRQPGLADFYRLGSDVEGGVGAFQNFHCSISLATQPAIYTGNSLLDCDGEVPHNETTVVVNPFNPSHIVGGYHSYILRFKGATSSSYVVSAASASFDGGATWQESIPPQTPYQFTGDPALAFAASGRLYYANIADHEGPGGNFTAPSVVVAYSDDGGMTWSNPNTVAKGQAAITAGKWAGNEVFNDKEYIAADANPASPYASRAYVTWTRFGTFQNARGFFTQWPIMVSWSDNGRNWSTGQPISGFHPACTNTYSGAPNQCDLNQDSYPAVGSDGRVYVSFENFNTPAENQAMIVRSNDGGRTWSSPVRIDTLYDINFPSNVDGRDTLTGCALRYSVKGNTAVDPNDPNIVYVVWADNRNGNAAATNTDVFLARSTDGGATWTVDNIDSAANDQFYPWVDVAPSGRVDVGYMDRSYSAGQSECKYGFTVARVTYGGGPPAVVKTRVDSAISHADNSRWFGRNSRFIGDYNGLDVGPDGKTWSLWTDYRANPVVGDPLGRYGQHAVGVGLP